MAIDEDRFRIRPGRVRDRSGDRSMRAVRSRSKTFPAEVHQAVRRADGERFDHYIGGVRRDD